jgi:hypothetical protein
VARKYAEAEACRGREQPRAEIREEVSRIK